uniref:Purine rich element binding protein G n=1 Tax=Sus scrofa TaxID=9823 RepID=A0A8D2BK28_PIG
MEMTEMAKQKTLWKMNSTSEPLFVTGIEVNPLKKFTIPKIRRTAGKVSLSSCCTNTREYSFIHNTLNQCRLDVSCDLQSSWQFGDTKLVHNEDLEKNFTSKRSEMRESGRHGRELEEHFCFLALPQSDVAEIYQNGISTKASSLKILGNPLLGIYIFRHVDVALNYAHSRSITVESIIIFKVLFGKVKKIQPSMDKNKVSLDPSPNFDCHMSRSTPSLKDTIELQAYSSAVYFYEYNVLSKPVDKPRQCLPYAVVTVKFIGQKVDNGHFMTSLRCLSTGFPKRAERICSLNNCTVAKRIGKGKDATVIFEHFRKPVDPFVQENCSCNALNSAINSSNSHISNSCGNVQNGNISILETYSGQNEHNLEECRDTSQVHAYNSSLSLIPSDTRESVNNGDLLNLTQLKDILSGLAAAFPVHNNIGSSTVVTSKLIKDPRLMKREESMGKHNTVTGLNEILPLEKSLDFDNSEINLSSLPANSASSSEVMPGDDTVLTNYLDVPCCSSSFDDSQTQGLNLSSKTYDYTASNKITMTEQYKSQDNFSFTKCVPNVVSEVEIQKHGKEKPQGSRKRSNLPLLIEQNSEPHDSYESVNTCTKGYSHISPESQSSNFNTMYQTAHQMSTVFPLQSKESVREYIQNSGNMRNFTGPESDTKHEEKQNFWKESDNSFTNKTRVSQVDNYISLHQDYKKDKSLHYLGRNCDQTLITQELEKPKSSASNLENKYELDHLALEVEDNHASGVESLPQKRPRHSYVYEDNIHTGFSISQKLTELTLEKPDQNCVSIMTDAFQEAKDIPQARQLPADTSSHDIKIAHDNANCSIPKEHIYVPKRNENYPVSLENIQTDCKETPQINSKYQVHTQFCNTHMNNDVYMNTNFKEQRDNKENQKEVQMEGVASSTENNIENIYGDEKKTFHTNKNFTNTEERRENKNYSSMEILSSKEFSATFNLTWGTKYVSTESALLENEDTVSAVGEKDLHNPGRTIEHLVSTTFPKSSVSSVHVSPHTALQVAGTTVPALGTNCDIHHRYQCKETCSSQSPDFDLLLKHKVSDHEMDMDKNQLHNSFHQSVSDTSIPQSFKVDNEIEIESEQNDDAFLFQQDTHNHGNVLYEELGASYEALKSRIDWEGLLGSKNGEVEVVENVRENIDQHCSEESNCFYSSTQKNEAELFNSILLPDLQIKIANVFMQGFSPTVESLALKDNFCKCINEATKSEINKEEGEALGFKIHSQCSGENSDHPSEGEFGNVREESGLVSKSEISLSFDLSHNTHMNHMSEEKKNSGPLLTEPSNVTTVNNESRYSLTKSKADCNDTRNKNNTESRISKRKPYTPFRDQNMPHKDLRHHEICGKKRLTRQDSSECFSSLSQGRIKTFSQSEKHIRSVLEILNSEASLCKSRRLSRKLDRAVLHLKKAHRRVHTSLQLIAKVGEKRKGPLPKAYAIICNNFWESCDLHGYSSVSERRYYSTKHFLSKRKHDKAEEKRVLRFEVNESLTHISKHKSYKTSGEKIAKCLSKKNVSSVSRSHTTILMREFCDQAYPESQLALCSPSQSTSQLADSESTVRNPRSSELQPFSGKTECLFSSDCPDEKLTEKENQSDTKLSNMGKYENLENHSACSNIKDTTKENISEANEVINKRNSLSLNCIKENNVSFSMNKNYDATCIGHTKTKTHIVISVLESSVKRFFNLDIYKPDNLILCDKRNLEVNFPMESWTAPNERSKSGITTGNFLMDPLNLTLITSRKCNSIPQLLSTTLVTDSEKESSKSYLDKQSIFAVDSSAASTTAPHCQQRCGGKELLNTEQCSSNNCSHIDENETNVIDSSKLDFTPVSEESKSYGENMMKKLSSSDSSLLLKYNMKGSSSKQCIAKKDIEDRKIGEDKQAEKTEYSVHKNMTEGSAVKIEYKNQKNKVLEDSSYLIAKTIKNNLTDSHLSIKNATEAVSMNNMVSNQLKKREKEEGIKVSHDSQSDSTLHPEIACHSKPDVIGMNHMPLSHAYSETFKASTPQRKPTSYMNELKEKHCSANRSALIARLAQILRRADEASSLQILQEETKVCQTILPLFVKAFERKQECSFEQILISRDLLVEQNLWNNCRHKLKPCAIDSLVELQMMMETIQFIENKKRLLGGEPTFRSLLWYDETLYSELLGRPRGFQQQSNFYPAFQGRLKYNAFCELQDYHDQLIELFEKTKRENNLYYAFLKYKRQINECEAIMKHCSDCFDFSLSVPFACGVNFGDSLGDLEAIRKTTLKLISMYGDSPLINSYPGKQDHLWIIIEMISSKVNFIKSSEAVSIKISLYGLEHIFFDAAKSLIWKEKRQSFCKKYSGKKNKEILLKMNQHAFSKLQKIYDTLSKDLSSEQISSIGLEKNTMIASRKSNALVNKTTVSSRFNSTLLSHPDICCISEILDQAEFADLKKLQELTLRCTSHLDILKKYFQLLQEDNVDNIFITEDNVLDMVKNHSHEAVILKPAAIEIYIEIVMLSETVHFLKNSMAKKLDKQRFRGMLWFDLSLLPELVQCQEKMSSFSFLKSNSTDCLWKVIETAISELNKDLDIIYKYNEAVNCSYALHLLSRELEELSEIKKLLKKSKYSISTYVDFVPCIASINYGSTVTDLEHNYNQFSTLLKNIMAAPRKDLGKMAHIMKVMKTIEHMKMICVKNTKLTISFILCQMLHNRKKTIEPKRGEKMNAHVEPRKSIKSSTCVKVSSISECIMDNTSNSSKKRPITLEKYEDSQEQEKNTTVSSCKKQKVNMKDVTKINRGKATFKHPRTTRSHPKSENEIGPGSSDSLRNHVSPKKVEIQRSLPGSLLPLKNLKDTCTLKSEGKTGLTSISSTTSEDFTGQQKDLNSMKKRNVNVSAAETKSDKKDCSPLAISDQKSVDGTFSKDSETPSQKFKNSPDPAEKSCSSDLKPGADATLLPDGPSVLAKPIFHFVKDIHANLEINVTDFELQDNEMLNSTIKNSTCASSPEPTLTQNKIPVPQVNKTQLAKTESKEKYMKDTWNPNTLAVETFENMTLNVDQTVDYSFSEPQIQKSENSNVLTQNASTYWNEHPQSACTPVYHSSEHSFGTSYPYYAWYVYHYSSSSNGSSITQTYQGITSYGAQPPPPGMLTAIASTVENTYSNILYSQYFSYCAGEPQANDFVPVNGYFHSQMPVYSCQQPVFSQYVSHQPVPQTAYPYSPDSGVLPEVPWAYVPWQQEPFQRGH